MKIATKSIAWTDPQAGADVANIHIYYAQGNPTFSYELPKVVVPAVLGQQEYSYLLPGAIPLTEGEWTLFICFADAEGNISDPASLTRFFDFTAPRAPENLKVI